MGIDRKKFLDTLDTLTDALGNSDCQSVEEIKDELRDDGVDVESVLSRLKMTRKNIAMGAKRSALEEAKEKRLKASEQVRGLVGKFNDWTKEQIFNRIKEIGGPEAGLAYRDLASMGHDEMASILEDLELAKIRTQEEGRDEE